MSSAGVSLLIRAGARLVMEAQRVGCIDVLYRAELPRDGCSAGAPPRLRRARSGISSSHLSSASGVPYLGVDLA